MIVNHMELNIDQFNELSSDEKDLYLKSHYDSLKDVVFNWGNRFDAIQDNIQKNQLETVQSLNKIGESLSKFTQAIFGDKGLEYIGVVKMQKDLEDRVDIIEKQIYEKMYGIRDVNIKNIETIEKELADIVSRVKWTTRIVWFSLAGAVTFATWFTDKAIQICEIIKNIHPR